LEVANAPLEQHRATLPVAEVLARVPSQVHIGDIGRHSARADQNDLLGFIHGILEPLRDV
jgi:hypothetical protein